VERKGPTQDRKTSAEEQLLDAMTDSLIGALNEAILMVGSSASGTEPILEIPLEEKAQGRISKEFATLIEEHVAVREVGGNVLVKPATKPFKRSGFRQLGRSKESLVVMVADEDEAGFTIAPQIVLLAGEILGALANKSKVHGQTLVHLCGSASGRVATITMAHLSSETHWALLENGPFILELRNASSIAMGVDKFVVGAVSQALMPEKTCGSAGKLTNSQRVGSGTHQRQIGMTMRAGEKQRLGVAELTEE
jgi:hypothetical protein